jgi:hypothetical protein
MAHAVPSQVCDLIVRLFPTVYQQTFQPGSNVLLDPRFVKAVLDVLDKVPEELLKLPATDATTLWANVSALQLAFDDRAHTSQHPQTRPLPPSNLQPVGEIYRLLNLCPDEIPAPATAGLEFVTDIQLRAVLRTDLSAAASALANHEYKAATVLAGSVVESLLLWALETTGMAAVRKAVTTGLPPRSKQMNEWALGQLIYAAHGCRLIDNDTQKQADLAQNYRNLIHPGRQARLQDKCDRGTAYGALAAVERVAVDLAVRFPPP